MGKVLIGIIAIFMLLGAFASPISAGIKTWRTNDTTESFGVTSDAGGAANMTLSHDLYQASKDEVQSVSSNVAAGAYASSYVEATKMLVAGGLTALTTQTLTLRYYAETDDTIMRIIGPFLAVLIIGGLVVAVIWEMLSKKRR